MASTLIELLILVGRLVLAVVFGVAGAAKIADRAGARKSLVDFGVPASLARPVAGLLPVVEIACAAAVLSSFVWWGAAGSLALLVLFIAGIGTSLALGRKPNCRCFGQLHSSPVGASTVVRNGILSAIATLIVWQGSSTSIVFGFSR